MIGIGSFCSVTACGTESDREAGTLPVRESEGDVAAYTAK